MKTVIGVCGFKRSGKDTLAMALAPYGFKQVGFADLLKQMSMAIDPLVGWDKGDPLHLADLVKTVGWEEAKTYPYVRRFLQRLGSEGVRDHLGENTWVDALIGRLWAEDHQKWVVTDVRFPNEADALKENFKATLVRVDRPGYGSDGHVSEEGVMQITVDLVLENDQDLDSFINKVVRAFVPGVSHVGG